MSPVVKNQHILVQNWHIPVAQDIIQKIYSALDRENIDWEKENNKIEALAKNLFLLFYNLNHEINLNELCIHILDSLQRLPKNSQNISFSPSRLYCEVAFFSFKSVTEYLERFLFIKQKWLREQGCLDQQELLLGAAEAVEIVALSEIMLLKLLNSDKEQFMNSFISPTFSLLSIMQENKQKISEHLKNDLIHFQELLIFTVEDVTKKRSSIYGKTLQKAALKLENIMKGLVILFKNLLTKETPLWEVAAEDLRVLQKLKYGLEETMCALFFENFTPMWFEISYENQRNFSLKKVLQKVMHNIDMFFPLFLMLSTKENIFVTPPGITLLNSWSLLSELIPLPPQTISVICDTKNSLSDQASSYVAEDCLSPASQEEEWILPMWRKTCSPAKRARTECKEEIVESARTALNQSGDSFYFAEDFEEVYFEEGLSTNDLITVEFMSLCIENNEQPRARQLKSISVK